MTQKPTHIPSPQEIRQITAEIQAGWSESDRLLRAKWMYEQPAQRSPVVPDESQMATWREDD